MQFVMRRLLTGLIGLTILLFSCASPNQSNNSRLDLIKKRNELVCGVSGKIPGFSFLDSNGRYRGLDIDICRAFAAGIIGDPEKIQYRPLTAAERFTAIKTGEIDLLSRNTTFNLSRDSLGGNGLTFSPVIFYDGQGLMVKKNSGVNNIKDLANKSICVGSGTTTEQNINDAFESIGIPYTPIKYQDLNQVIAGYLQGRCAAMTSDRSQLAAARSGFKDPKKHIILPDVLSKEPLAPASEGNDHKLSDAMRWIIYALIEAEEKGITKANIDSWKDTKDAEIHNNIGGAFNNIEKFDKAINHFEQAIVLDPLNAKTYNNLGLVYYRQGKHKKAISKLEKAISLNPNFVKAYIILGRALINSGKINEAKKNFEKVLEIQPNQKESSYFLAMLNGETPNKPPREYVESLFDALKYRFTAPPTLKSAILFDPPIT